MVVPTASICCARGTNNPLLYIFDVKSQQMRSNQLNSPISQESFFSLCAFIQFDMSYVTSTIQTPVDRNKICGLLSNCYDWLVFKRIYVYRNMRFTNIFHKLYPEWKMYQFVEWELGTSQGPYMFIFFPTFHDKDEILRTIFI